MAVGAIRIAYIANDYIAASVKKAMQDEGERVAVELGYTVFEFPVIKDDPDEALIGSLMDASDDEINSFLKRIKLLWRPTRWEKAERHKYLGREEFGRERIEGEDKIMFWDEKTAKAYTEYRGKLKWNSSILNPPERGKQRLPAALLIPVIYSIMQASSIAACVFALFVPVLCVVDALMSWHKPQERSWKYFWIQFVIIGITSSEYHASEYHAAASKSSI